MLQKTSEAYYFDQRVLHHFDQEVSKKPYVMLIMNLGRLH